MAYTVKFYTFSKRTNSTKIPGDLSDIDFSCELLDGSGLLKPTIILKPPINPQNLSYAKIVEFDRFYFVENWRFLRGLWEADLTVDVLGTYRTEIGEMTCMINRSSAAQNGRIPDPAAVSEVGVSYAVETNTNTPFASSIANGYYVVGVINSDANSVGAVSYYVMTNAEFRAFSAKLLSSTDYLGSISDISEQLTKVLFNPFSYISSCIWIPVQPPTSGNVTTIPVGWWEVAATAKKLSATIRSGGSLTISVPKHPDALTRGYWLLAEPYSQYYLDFQPFGAVTIPASALVDCDLLDFQWTVDCITGEGTLRIGANALSGGTIGYCNVLRSQVGVPVQIANSSMGLVAAGAEALESGVGSLLGVKFDNPQGNAIDRLENTFMSLAKGVGAYMLSRVSPLQSLGSNGTYTSGYFPVRLTGTFSRIAAQNNDEIGRPLCEVRKIADIPGYIEIASPQFSGGRTDTERDTINRLLMNGAYYE